jgi:hypothetical protein
MQPPKEVGVMASMNSPSAPQKLKLLNRVRLAIRAHHYSPRTEDAYIGWIRRYIFFHGKRHPIEMGAEEVTRFLSSLAVDGRVAASTHVLNRGWAAVRSPADRLPLGSPPPAGLFAAGPKLACGAAA